ncbi:MAG: bacteriohemerythrin [Bacteroidales bacterium]|nr:bacteriohemerythrin [Bacteroidales bacterium]MDD3430722.1 bacteriohemerythrin [Bacteroidales bacterium]MDD4361002.1 bacteriohemerythrin [Bacteroidales bacterium]MDD4431768.1 bacteriohemerythrin [Bacteroidales bacterium]
MEFLISWKKEYEIGIPEIDSQHQFFVGIIQKINAAYANDQDKDYISLLIKELYKYVDFHFISEENNMIFHNYPEYKNHKKEHDALLSRLSELIGVFESEFIDRSELMDFLMNWFVEHTTKTDKKLGDYIRLNN